MITDTLVVVLMCLSPAQPLPVDVSLPVSDNRFSQSFREADREFERKYHLTEKLREAAKQAVRSADRETADERNKILNSTQWMKEILIELQNKLTYEYP